MDDFDMNTPEKIKACELINRVRTECGYGAGITPAEMDCTATSVAFVRYIREVLDAVRYMCATTYEGGDIPPGLTAVYKRRVADLDKFVLPDARASDARTASGDTLDKLGDLFSVRRRRVRGYFSNVTAWETDENYRKRVMREIAEWQA